MKTIEPAADDFICETTTTGLNLSAAHLADERNAYLAGVEFANQWHEIERNSYDGFATDRCLDDMFANLPVLVYDALEVHLIQGDNVVDWRGEIEQSTDYTHWRPIKLPTTQK